MEKPKLLARQLPNDPNHYNLTQGFVIYQTPAGKNAIITNVTANGMDPNNLNNGAFSLFVSNEIYPSTPNTAIYEECPIFLNYTENNGSNPTPSANQLKYYSPSNNTIGLYSDGAFLNGSYGMTSLSGYPTILGYYLFWPCVLGDTTVIKVGSTDLATYINPSDGLIRTWDRGIASNLSNLIARISVMDPTGISAMSLPVESDAVYISSLDSTGNANYSHVPLYTGHNVVYDNLAFATETNVNGGYTLFMNQWLTNFDPANGSDYILYCSDIPSFGDPAFQELSYSDLSTRPNERVNGIAATGGSVENVFILASKVDSNVARVYKCSDVFDSQIWSYSEIASDYDQQNDNQFEYYDNITYVNGKLIAIGISFGTYGSKLNIACSYDQGDTWTKNTIDNVDTGPDVKSTKVFYNNNKYYIMLPYGQLYTTIDFETFTLEITADSSFAPNYKMIGFAKVPTDLRSKQILNNYPIVPNNKEANVVELGITMGENSSLMASFGTEADSTNRQISISVFGVEV
jgi:hypothetical protein